MRHGYEVGSRCREKLMPPGDHNAIESPEVNAHDTAGKSEHYD